MSAVAFSGDGSLVAAAVTGSVTLWDPSSNALITVLANPAPARSSTMTHLQFVPSTQYLVRRPHSKTP
jgi:WD40 repeat protein